MCIYSVVYISSFKFQTNGMEFVVSRSSFDRWWGNWGFKKVGNFSEVPKPDSKWPQGIQTQICFISEPTLSATILQSTLF